MTETTLCIDQGNTRTKLALFEQDRLRITHIAENSCAKEKLLQIIKGQNPVRCIFSSVAAQDEAFLHTLRLSMSGKRLLVFNHNTPTPLQNKYRTPQTLGLDRLAAAVGANAIKRDCPLLIIDAGSAITYDFVDENNCYVGGNIAPGMRMRFMALHQHTGQLPLIQPQDPIDIPPIGSDTHTAITSGVITGITHEMNGYYDTLCRSQKTPFVFLTGGDAKYFHNRVKFTNFAEDNLVLTGLKRILDYNAQ